jgi:hypothetical protein
VLQVAAYALVVVLAVELAVAEAFLVGLRVHGEALPVAAVVAAVGNVVLGRAGGKLVRASWGSVVPGVLWFLVVFPLGVAKAEGDVILTSDLRGYALLAVGSVAVVVGAVGGRATPAGANGR